MLSKDCERMYILRMIYNPKFYLFFIFIVTSIPICLFGYNSDESYTTIAYQLACGDKFLREIWTLYVFPEALIAPFVWLYLKIFGGTTGIILYLRILGCVFSGVVSFFVYDSMRYIGGKKVAFFSALAFFCFSPSNMCLLNYKSIQIWSFMMTCVCFLNYRRKQRRAYLWGAGIFSVVGVAGYPTSVIIIPFYMFLSVYITNNTAHGKRHKWAYLHSLIFTGLVFCIMFLGVTDIGYINNIFEPLKADAHPINIGEAFLNMLKAYGAGALLGMCPLLLSDCIYEKILVNSKSKVLFPLRILFRSRGAILTLWFLLFSIALFFNPFITPNPNTQLYSIGMLFFAGIALYKKTDFDNKKILFLLFNIPPFICSFAVFFTSNQALPAVWITPFILALPFLFLIMENGQGKQGKTVARLFGFCVCLLLIVSRVLFVTASRSAQEFVFSPRKQITDGPSKYIFVAEAYHDIYYNEWDIIQNYCKENDKIFIIAESGLDRIGYLMSSAKISENIDTLSPNSPRYEAYYKTNPDRIPTLVIAPWHDYNEVEAFLNTTYLGGLLATDYDFHQYEGITLFLKR